MTRADIRRVIVEELRRQGFLVDPARSCPDAFVVIEGDVEQRVVVDLDALAGRIEDLVDGCA